MSWQWEAEKLKYKNNRLEAEKEALEWHNRQLKDKRTEHANDIRFLGIVAAIGWLIAVIEWMVRIIG